MIIYIVTNNYIQAKAQVVELDKAGKLNVPRRLITLVKDLLALPDGSSVHILDYRTGHTPEDICEVARLMVKRGSFYYVWLKG